MREPWSEPYSRRERIDMRLIWWAYRWRRWHSETVPIWIAKRLPRPVRRWVIVLAASNSGRDLEPDQITYPLIYDANERR